LQNSGQAEDFLMTSKSGYNILRRHYVFLRICKLLGFTTFRVNISNISTKNKKITIGQECQYKEGSTLERAVIEDIWFNKYLINLKIRFIETSHSFVCNHVLDGIGYAGMWRIYDKDYYDIEEWRREENQ
jgi:hypothetical protein